MVCRIGAMSVLVDMDSAKIPVEAFRYITSSIIHLCVDSSN